MSKTFILAFISSVLLTGCQTITVTSPSVEPTPVYVDVHIPEPTPPPAPVVNVDTDAFTKNVEASNQQLMTALGSRLDYLEEILQEAEHQRIDLAEELEEQHTAVNCSDVIADFITLQLPIHANDNNMSKAALIRIMEDYKDEFYECI